MHLPKEEHLVCSLMKEEGSLLAWTSDENSQWLLRMVLSGDQVFVGKFFSTMYSLKFLGISPLTSTSTRVSLDEIW